MSHFQERVDSEIAGIQAFLAASTPDTKMHISVMRDQFDSRAYSRPGVAIAVYLQIALDAPANTYAPLSGSREAVSQPHVTAHFLLATRQAFQNALNEFSGVSDRNAPEQYTEEQQKEASGAIAQFLTEVTPATVNLSSEGQPRTIGEARNPLNREFNEDKFVFNGFTWQALARVLQRLGPLDPTQAFNGLAALRTYGDWHLSTEEKSATIAESVARNSDPAALAAAKLALLDTIIDDLKTHAVAKDDLDGDYNLADKITIFAAANPFIDAYNYRNEAYFREQYQPHMVNSPELRAMFVTAAEKVRAFTDLHPDLKEEGLVKRVQDAVLRMAEDLTGNERRMAELQKPEPQVAIAVPPVAQPDLSQTQPPPVRRGIFGLRK
jgi:hypothetical protein